MLHLIKKDILIQKKNVILAIVYVILFTLFISKNETIGFAIAVLATTYLLTQGASALEDKNNNDKMLISLPIKKKKIVMSKYASVYIFALFAIILCYLIYIFAKIISPSYIKPVTIDGIVLSTLLVTLLCSISFPLIFKYGYMKARMANLLLFFVLVFGSAELVNILPAINKTNVINLLTNLTHWQGMVLLIIPVIFFLIISYTISLRFYKRREF